MTVVNLRTLICTILFFPCITITLAVNSQVDRWFSNKEDNVHPIEYLFSSHRYHKGYEESLALITSLNLPPSCLYSSLTESIISKCSSSPNFLNGEEKTYFATKLAICELSSANVDYPRDCRSDIQSPRDIQRCIRKLENRPQWWTSWSNCIQSVGVLCQAVREEAERDNLLKLHRNLTILHYQLENQLATSLKILSTDLEHADGASNTIKSKLSSLIQEFESLMDRTISPVDKRLQNLRGVTESISQLQTSHAIKLAEQNVVLSERADAQRSSVEKTGEIIEQILETTILLETKLNARIKLDEESRLEYLEQMQIAIKSSATNTLDSIKESMKSLDTLSNQAASAIESLLDSISRGKTKMEDINEGFDTLSSTHEKMSSTIRSQEESSLKHLNSLHEFAVRFNDTLVSILSESTLYLQKLETSHLNSQPRPFDYNIFTGQEMITTYLPLIVSLLVLIDRKRTAIMIFTMAVMYTFCVTASWNDLGNSPSKEESTTKREDFLIDGSKGDDLKQWLNDCGNMAVRYIYSFF
ncbi:hypothetical protein TWF694_010575 [Orbilia ellipsospora]|uniref:Nuclear fusion protein KAR5 n=1 Tax=Orbilia ellipsospora TaxID=2528407 RepID=A0AAV9XGJ6_9PEZI